MNKNNHFNAACKHALLIALLTLATTNNKVHAQVCPEKDMFVVDESNTLSQALASVEQSEWLQAGGDVLITISCCFNDCTLDRPGDINIDWGKSNIHANILIEASDPGKGWYWRAPSSSDYLIRMMDSPGTLTLQGVYAVGKGLAPIWNEGGTLYIKDSSVWGGSSSMAPDSIETSTHESWGGCINTYVGGVTYVSNVYVGECSSPSGDGGSIRVQGPGSEVYITDSIIESGRAYNGGCICATDYALVSISNSKISRCTATYQGGGIFAEKSASLIIGPGTVIEGNQAIGGAGVSVNEAQSFVATGGIAGDDESKTAIIITQNKALSLNMGFPEGSGGGIQIYSTGSVRLEGNIIISNNVANWGAGIDINQRGGRMGRQDSTIVSGSLTLMKNMATERGGGIHCSSFIEASNIPSDVYISDAEPGSNEEDLRVLIYDTSTDAHKIVFEGNVTFISNQAKWGGGIYINAIDVFFNGPSTSFLNNSAMSGSAGLYISNVATGMYRADILTESRPLSKASFSSPVVTFFGNKAKTCTCMSMDSNEYSRTLIEFTQGSSLSITYNTAETVPGICVTTAATVSIGGMAYVAMNKGTVASPAGAYVWPGGRLIMQPTSCVSFVNNIPLNFVVATGSFINIMTPAYILAQTPLILSSGKVGCGLEFDSVVSIDSLTAQGKCNVSTIARVMIQDDHCADMQNSACPIGMRWRQGACVKECPMGSFYSIKLGVCKPCCPASTLSLPQAASYCPPAAQPLGDSCSTSCPAGFYMQATGKEATSFVCSPCPDGTFSASPGLSSANDCMPCPIGTVQAMPPIKCINKQIVTQSTPTASPQQENQQQQQQQQGVQSGYACPEPGPLVVDATRSLQEAVDYATLPEVFADSNGEIVVLISTCWGPYNRDSDINISWSVDSSIKTLVILPFLPDVKWTWSTVSNPSSFLLWVKSGAAAKVSGVDASISGVAAFWNQGGTLTLLNSRIHGGRSSIGPVKGGHWSACINSFSAARTFVVNCAIRNCTSPTGFGGAIQVKDRNSAVWIINSNIRSSTALNGGCIAALDRSRVNVMDSTMVSTCTAIGIDAMRNGGGGGIYVSTGANLTITGAVTIQKNIAGSMGGGILCMRGCSMSIKEGSLTMQQNIAGGMGGAIAWVNNSDRIFPTSQFVVNSSFILQENSAFAGSAMYIYKGNASFIRDISFMYNKGGSALFVFGKSQNIENGFSKPLTAIYFHAKVTFQGNTADGGGIPACIQGSNAIISFEGSETIFIQNLAIKGSIISFSGEIYFVTGMVKILENFADSCVVVAAAPMVFSPETHLLVAQNVARAGAGFCVTHVKNGRLDILGTAVIVDNTANERGAAIFVAYGYSLKLNNARSCTLIARNRPHNVYIQIGGDIQMPPYIHTPIAYDGTGLEAFMTLYGSARQEHQWEEWPSSNPSIASIIKSDFAPHTGWFNYPVDDQILDIREAKQPDISIKCANTEYMVIKGSEDQPCDTRRVESLSFNASSMWADTCDGIVCPIGTIWKYGACMPESGCGAGNFYRISTGTCESCCSPSLMPIKQCHAVAPSTSPSASCVSSCPPGRSIQRSTGWNIETMVCAKCAVGTYSSTHDATSCTQCADGYSTIAPGATNCLTITDIDLYIAEHGETPNYSSSSQLDLSGDNTLPGANLGVYSTTPTPSLELNDISSTQIIGASVGGAVGALVVIISATLLVRRYCLSGHATTMPVGTKGK